MTAAAVALLAALEARGFTLWGLGLRLIVRPRNRLTTEQEAAVIEHKPELLALLYARADDDRGAWETACESPAPAAALTDWRPCPKPAHQSPKRSGHKQAGQGTAMLW